MDTAPLAVALVVVALTVYIFARRAARARGRCRVTQIVVCAQVGAAWREFGSSARRPRVDRLWMVVDMSGAFVSQRRAPLALVAPALPASRDAPLVLRAPGMARRCAPVVAAPVVAGARVWGVPASPRSTRATRRRLARRRSASEDVRSCGCRRRGARVRPRVRAARQSDACSAGFRCC